MTASVSSTVSNVFPFNNAVSGAYGGVNNVESYLDRTNGETVSFGDIRKFAGFYHRCVFPLTGTGTLAGAEPTIIAPLGAPELVINGDFNSASGWVVPASMAITGGECVVTASSSEFLTRALTFENTKSYLGQCDLVRAAGTGFRLPYDGVVGNITTVATTGHHAHVFTSTGSATVYSGFASAFTGTLDNVSIVEVTKDGTVAWETIQII